MWQRSAAVCGGSRYVAAVGRRCAETVGRRCAETVGVRRQSATVGRGSGRYAAACYIK
ncbi:MAG: hypothetical protein IJ555_09795 [Ruminococcus sp.]|nr:hypothetical protein [Ruminococcus sp.]MBR1749880.1 hypothetical protein [Ruminococcus sp.]